MSGIDFNEIESLKISLSEDMIRHGKFISDLVKLLVNLIKRCLPLTFIMTVLQIF